MVIFMELFLFLRISFVHEYEFKDFFSISEKKNNGNSIITVLYLFIAFANIAIFTLLILWVNEHRNQFHLLASSSFLFSVTPSFYYRGFLIP